MAERTKIYQEIITRHYALSHPSRNDAKTQRWLVRFVPAENVPLLAEDVTFDDLPEGTILEKSNGDMSFPDGVLIGMPEAEQWSLEIDYRKLPSDLKTWLTADSTVTATIEGQTYFVSGVFILSSDRGDATLDPDGFVLEFMGVHRHQGRASYRLEEKKGRIVIDITLQHILKACLDAVPIDALRSFVIDNYLASMEVHSELYTTLYQATGHNRTYGVGYSGRGLQWAWLLPIELLEQSLLLLLEQVFITYMRTDDALAWVAADGVSLGVVTDDTIWTFYKQLYDGSRDAGAALSDPWAAQGHIVALVSTSATPADTSPESSEWIGGLLGGGENADGQPFGRGDDTLFALGNCYDVVRYMAETFGVKVLPMLVFGGDTYSAGIECMPPTADGYDGGAPYALVAPADFIGTITWTPNENDLRGCEYEVPDVAGDDRDTVSHFTQGSSANEKAHKLTALVHNLPLVSDLHSRLAGNNAVVVEAGLALTGNYSIAMHWITGFDVRGLYYLDTPGFAGSEIAIRVCSGCTYKYGYGASGPGPDVRQITLDLVGFDYPSIADLGSYYTPANKLTYNSLVFFPLLAALIVEQRSINMLSAVCRFVVKLYARNTNSDDNPHGAATLKGTLVGHWPPSITGRRLQLDDGSTGFSEAGTDTTLWDLTPSQRSVAITSAKANDLDGTTDVEGVATDDRQFYEVP